MTLFDRYDADKDGGITLEELDGAQALMRLDKNGDGVLTGREAMERPGPATERS